MQQRLSLIAEEFVIFATHHKVGTALMSKVCDRLAHRFALPLVRCPVPEVTNGSCYSRLRDACLVLDTHSRIDLLRLPHPPRVVHLIRDPREVVVSGYLYHLKCSEAWCLNPEQRYGNRSYQELLRALPQNEGLDAEIEFVANGTIRDMVSWECQRGKMLEVKFEDLMQDFDRAFSRIFEFCFTLEETAVTNLLHSIKDFDLARSSSDDLNSNAHVTNYTRKQRRWEDFLSSEQICLLGERYGDFMKARGYL